MYSERLTYRRSVRDDLKDLHALDNDPDVMEWINGGQPVSLDQFTGQVLPVYLSSLDGSLFGFWVIEVSGEFAGWVSLRPGDKPLEASMGYRLKKSAWGMGYATEAARWMLERAFNEERLEMVTATTYEGNVGSQRVLAKIGMRLAGRFQMTEEGLLRQDTSLSTGEVWGLDDLEFEITSNEFG
jgi:RimJ/RimL family protein N-acetyltransferase